MPTPSIDSFPRLGKSSSVISFNAFPVEMVEGDFYRVEVSYY